MSPDTVAGLVLIVGSLLALAWSVREELRRHDERHPVEHPWLTRELEAARLREQLADDAAVQGWLS